MFKIRDLDIVANTSGPPNGGKYTPLQVEMGSLECEGHSGFLKNSLVILRLLLGALSRNSVNPMTMVVAVGTRNDLGFFLSPIEASRLRIYFKSQF